MNLAINGSPRGAAGVTALILEPFLEGLGGAELLQTKELNIRPCRGCLAHQDRDGD